MRSCEKEIDDANRLENEGLASAVDTAIKRSLLVIEELRGGVAEAFNSLESVSAKAKAHTGNDQNANDAIRSFEKELRQIHAEASSLFERQRNVLQNVNIALFGRTGAGKSSIIEALTFGNGATISTGESDFTTEVRSVSWRGCKFYDTPGTNGWGRSEKRIVLEDRAKKSVEVSDIVVLCFDTQSQQQGEFDKIGAWVKEYGKPVIAVLNVRNPLWRRSIDVPLGSQRQRLSRSVSEHVSNIETELSALGIFNSPIIAISAQRAVYARVKGEYRGPELEQFRKMRTKFGADILFEGSNFKVLESIIVEALTNHASELRLGMLYGQVHGMLSRLEDSLKRINDTALSAANILDRTIDGLFAVVGYPTSGSAKRESLPKTNQNEDILTWVESLRGGPFETRARGKFGHYVNQRLEAEMGTLRAQSLAEAERLVAEAFENRKDIDNDEFQNIVYSKKKIQNICEKVADDAAEFLRLETELVVRDTKLDIDFVFGQEQKVAGSSGKTRKIVSYALRGAGVVSGVASTIATIALLDPEPASKVVLTVVAIGAAVVSMVLGWFGSSQSKKAEEQRQRAWSSAIASARKNVNESYDGFMKQVLEYAESIVLSGTVQLLHEPLSKAGGFWSLLHEGRLALSNIVQLENNIPATNNSQIAIKEAATSVSSILFPNNSANVKLALLGEYWIQDKIGLLAEQGVAEQIRTTTYDPSFFKKLFEGMRGFVSRFGESVQPGAGYRWLKSINDILCDDPYALEIMKEVHTIYERGLPRFQLFGDYDSGKTSFIKRLLIDSGLTIPNTLVIRADPTTDQVHLYDWERVLLADAPGLQSTNEKHVETVISAYTDASAVIYLLQPNLLVGDTEVIERLFKGDHANGIISKLDRTLFVIHRTDELGADPEIVPNEYVLLCQRKKEELKQAFASRGITVEEDRIFCMAADPYQLVGDRRDVSSSQYDRFRIWDGFKEFRKAIRGIDESILNTAVDRSILEGGLSRFSKLQHSIEADRHNANTALDSINHISLILQQIIAEGERLVEEHKSKAKRLIDDHAFNELELVVAASNEAELETAAKKLAKWWDGPLFSADVEQWQTVAKNAADDWFQKGIEQIKRMIESPRFKSALARGRIDFDPESFIKNSKGWIGQILNIAAQAFKLANRENVYLVGKAAGVVFKPWGAVKLANVFGRVGVGLSALGVAIDVFSIYKDWKDEKRRKSMRKELRGFVEESARLVYESLTSDDESESGIIGYINEGLNIFKKCLSEVEGNCSELKIELSELDRRIRRYNECMDLAWDALGIKD